MNSLNFVVNSSLRFSHITHLTLTGNYIIDIRSFIETLSRIMPLTCVTYLHISDNSQNLKSCAKLLGHMPNVRTLVLDRIPTCTMPVLLEKEVNVTNVTLNPTITLDTAQSLMNLFPRMQCLNIFDTKDNIISIIRILSLKRIKDSQLCLLEFNGDNQMIEELKAMIDCEKLLDDYQIEPMYHGFCLWW